MSRKIGRRDALRGLGIGAAALGLGLGRNVVSGQTEELPKRVIFFYGGSGSRPGLWEPSGNETDWVVNSALHAPLEPFRDQITYIGNLHMLSAETDPTPPANAHIGGGTHAMTAAHRMSEDRSGSLSIDQAIVRAMEAEDRITALPSLEIQTNAGYLHAEGLPVYSGPGDVLPFIWNPVEVYDRLFPDGRPEPGMEDIRPLQRDRVLGFALDRFGRFEDPRLDAAARAKLQQHAEILGNVRRRQLAGLSRSAAIPERSEILAGVPERWQWDAEPDLRGQYWDICADRNTELVVRALAADVTRVITYYVHDAPGSRCPYDGDRYYLDGDFDSTGMHDLTHKVNDPDEPQSRDPGAQEVIRQQHLRTIEILADLLNRLQSTPEGDGTLLDYTLIVYCSQIADGSHALTSLPWFTVGHCQGAINTGRWLQSGDRRGHGALHRSVARALDLNLDDFGDDGSDLIPGLLT